MVLRKQAASSRSTESTSPSIGPTSSTSTSSKDTIQFHQNSFPHNASASTFSTLTWVDWLLLAVTIVLVLVCPLTKVEESFYLQATHDVSRLGPFNLANYDHFQFPGVVPRSFIPALFNAIIAVPLEVMIGLSALAGSGNAIAGLVSTRLSLALIGAVSVLYFRKTLQSVAGPRTATFTSLFLAVSFHIPFYLGRTLANTYATILYLFVYMALFRGKYSAALSMCTFVAVVIRCDTILLSAVIVLWLLLSRRATLLQIIKPVAFALMWTIPLTVLVDSYFWQRWCWPELEVLYFNTVQNQSSHWGTEPFLWYFYSALPRTLLAAFPFLLLSLFLSWNHRSTVHTYLWIPFAYILAYSFLPHKETRFIFPVLPLLFTGAGDGAAWLFRLFAADDSDDDTEQQQQQQQQQQKQAAVKRTHRFLPSTKRRFFHLLIGAAALLSAVATAFFAMASIFNYPGGFALLRLQIGDEGDVSCLQQQVRIHIDADAAMQGISRFLQRDDWYYSKQENLTDFTSFTHLITSKPEVEGFNLLFDQHGFDHYALDSQLLHTRAKIYVHRRRDLPPCR